MRATIYIDTIEQFDDIRNMADMAAVSSHPVRNMKELRENFYDKPNLVIEGRPTLVRAFMEKVQKMGFRVEVERFSVI
jgi:hypothetical protein